ncbi:hypothetical protein [Rhodococcus sp. LB1]|uniref:hypothetical protein n=1 Tax=Rhodococcus sp. LB1 TaxID=1807499 RepID=UPI00077B0245|nr:hypothetical protein [Rhodococcus sp. LB1]KXX62306.1 hypothetical protein AZG88_29915 [Rhodococcus sp. LB1]
MNNRSIAVSTDEARDTLMTSDVLDALSAHLGADPTGHLAFHLLSMLAVDHPGDLLDTIATAERLYPTS